MVGSVLTLCLLAMRIYAYRQLIYSHSPYVFDIKDLDHPECIWLFIKCMDSEIL